MCVGFTFSFRGPLQVNTAEKASDDLRGQWFPFAFAFRFVPPHAAAARSGRRE